MQPQKWPGPFDIIYKKIYKNIKTSFAKVSILQFGAYLVPTW